MNFPELKKGLQIRSICRGEFGSCCFQTESDPEILERIFWGARNAAPRQPPANLSSNFYKMFLCSERRLTHFKYRPTLHGLLGVFHGHQDKSGHN